MTDFHETHKHFRPGCPCIKCMPLHNTWVVIPDENGDKQAVWLKDEGNGTYGVYRNEYKSYGNIPVKVDEVTERKARALVLAMREARTK